MTAERMSTAKRIHLQNVAEREIMRYAGNHALWHKHVHNVDIDTMQHLKMMQMDEHSNTIDFSCRRTGKTACKEMYELEQTATQPDQTVGIVAPREGQAIESLDYHLDAIRSSQLLTAFIAHKQGRAQISDTKYEFANRSGAKAYGIMAQVDGGDLTIADLEEVDDMPHDRLTSRFLLMLASARKLRAGPGTIGKPQIRITGVFKGADTLSSLIESGQYHVLPTVNVHLGIEMGMIDAGFIAQMREQLSPDEYIRQLLCKNVSGRNLIWESWIRKAIHRGLVTALQPVEPLPTQQHRKRGLVSFGYDHLGHGEDPTSSRSSLVVLEEIMGFCCPVFAYVWPAGCDEAVIRHDLVRFWRYFNPDFGMGDAYGIGLLTQVNDDLFNQGLSRIDRRTIGEGQSTQSTWPEWAFSPIRFEGTLKHQMATSLRSRFQNNQVAIPYVDDLPETDTTARAIKQLIRQLGNIVPLPTSKSYASYKMANRKLGDDLFDAAMAANWALTTRGGAFVPTIVSTRQTTTEQILRPHADPTDPIPGLQMQRGIQEAS